MYTEAQTRINNAHVYRAVQDVARPHKVTKLPCLLKARDNVIYVAALQDPHHVTAEGEREREPVIGDCRVY